MGLLIFGGVAAAAWAAYEYFKGQCAAGTGPSWLCDSVFGAAAAVGTTPTSSASAGSQPAASSGTPPATNPAGPLPTTATLINVSRPGQPIAVGDTWHLIITGSPNVPVTGGAIQDGKSWGVNSFGSTDSTGHLSITGSMGGPNAGNWVETWTAGQGAPAQLVFTVAATPGVSGYDLGLGIPAYMLHNGGF